MADSRLVLTPSQRVDDPPRGDASPEVEIETPEATGPRNSRFEEIEDAETVDPPDGDSECGDPDDADGEMPRFLRHGDRRAYEPMDNGTERDAETEDTAGDGETHEEDDREEAAGDSDEDHGGEEDEAVPAGVDLGELEARIASFESAVAEQDDEWDPDGDTDDAYAAGSVSALPWQEMTDEEAEAPSASESRPADGDDAAPAHEDKKAEDHAGRQDEDDRSDDDRMSGAGGWYAEDAFVDEEALRDLVSEIVRQELQGALGERITRNVRKLVRREIHRALMSQGID